jgi:hypothetical protein
MKTLIQALAISAFLLALAPAANAQVSFGFRIGPQPAPRAYLVPRQPGPDYVWVEGYWYPQGSHDRWHDGYWTRPPYEGAYWVAPYNTGGRYFAGQWEGTRRNLAHDHRWDRSNQRDERRAPVNNRNNGRR